MTDVRDQVGVVFVNFHSEALIQPRVAPLRAAGYVVRVADNSSTYPDSELRVEIGRNVGFGAACNRAVDALPPTVTAICLHNPDVAIDPADIARLVRRLLSLPDPGACAPAIRVGDKIRMNGFHYPGVVRELLLAFRGSSPAGHPLRREPRHLAGRRVTGRGRRFASGALIVIDRRAFESLGGFDERFFLYGEDLDLWHRLAMDRRSMEFLPTIVADHESATSSPATRGTRELLRWMGVELFAEKHSYGSWRLMRSAHRSLLGRLTGVPLPLLEAVSDLWSRSATPAETSVAIRLLFASGDL